MPRFKYKFNEKYFYCPLFESREDFEMRMDTDLAAEVYNEICFTAASYADCDRSICLYVLFSILLADKIIKIDNGAYKWLIDNTIIEAKNDLKSLLKYCRKKKCMK